VCLSLRVGESDCAGSTTWAGIRFRLPSGLMLRRQGPDGQGALSTIRDAVTGPCDDGAGIFFDEAQDEPLWLRRCVEP